MRGKAGEGENHGGCKCPWTREERATEGGGGGGRRKPWKRKERRDGKDVEEEEMNHVGNECPWKRRRTTTQEGEGQKGKRVKRTNTEANMGVKESQGRRKRVYGGYEESQ